MQSVSSKDLQPRNSRLLDIHTVLIAGLSAMRPKSSLWIQSRINNRISLQESLNILPLFHEFVKSFSSLLNDNLNYCGYIELIEDMDAYCLLESNPCSIDAILENLSKKVLSLVGDFNTILQTYLELEWPEDDDDLIEDEHHDMGKSFGRVLRVVANYE